MERKEDVEEEVVTRIFVGGLGGSVTVGDLEKTFSSLGVVRGVDIVRTNGRSFAYIDFQPSSHNSLSKLFSKYNGCMWKGGRLRLEKAKENYLVRLKREWAEDAEVPKKPENDVVADKVMATSEKSKLLSPEKTQLQIFFPKLRKVKSLPYSGTGKHKYSFQRIEVPSLPIHFCDCEEHCGPFESAKEKQVSALEDPIGEINEEELNMMRSVMNKIFEKEVNSRTAYCETNMATEEDKSNQIVDDVPFDATAVDQDTDMDNLVMNMVSGGSGKLGLEETQGQGTLSEYQESKFRKRQLINDFPTQSKLEDQKVKKNTGGLNSSDQTSKKPRLLPEDESNRNEFTSTKHKKGNLGDSHSEESKGLKPARFTEQKANINQSTIDKTWIQKSSWRELVGQTANSSFSISHILTDSGAQHNWPKSNGLDTQSFIDRKQKNLVKQSRSKSVGNSSEALGHGKDGIPQDNVTIVVAPSETPSKVSECPKEAQLSDGKASTHQSTRGKDGIPQDNVTTVVAPSETVSKESECPKEAQLTDGKASTHQSTRGQAWKQKSSWRELVGEMDNSLFSISKILPGNATIQTIPKSSSSVTVNSINDKQHNLIQQLRSELTQDGANNSDVGNDGILQHKVTAPFGSNMVPLAKDEAILAGLESLPNNTMEQNLQNGKSDNSTYNKLPENKSHSGPNKKEKGEAGVGEVCTFMRSAASEREWMKTKATLSASLKKKSNEK